MASSLKSKSAVLGPVAFLLLTGCADYLGNKDTVSYRSGNAMDANTAIQEIEPWPPASYRTTVGSGG